MTDMKHEPTPYTRHYYVQYRCVVNGRGAVNGITCLKTDDSFFHIGQTAETLRQNLNADMCMITDWREISKAQADEYGEYTDAEKRRKNLVRPDAAPLISPA